MKILTIRAWGDNNLLKYSFKFSFLFNCFFSNFLSVGGEENRLFLGFIPRLPVSIFKVLVHISGRCKLHHKSVIYCRVIDDEVSLSFLKRNTLGIKKPLQYCSLDHNDSGSIYTQYIYLDHSIYFTVINVPC